MAHIDLTPFLLEMDYEQARELIYGMPYAVWKEKYQAEATPEHLAAFKTKQQKRVLLQKLGKRLSERQI